MPKKILAIACDLGAKNSGVYSAYYPSGCNINQFTIPEVVEKKAFTLTVEEAKNGGYQLLQNSRTAVRHALRCRKRNKQAKRLFIKTLVHCFNFPAEQHQEAIHHFLNRRGYSFLESDYSHELLQELQPSQLKQFIKEAPSLNVLINNQIDADKALTKLVNDSPESVALIYKEFKKLANHRTVQDFYNKVQASELPQYNAPLHQALMATGNTQLCEWVHAKIKAKYQVLKKLLEKDKQLLTEFKQLVAQVKCMPLTLPWNDKKGLGKPEKTVPLVTETLADDCSDDKKLNNHLAHLIFAIERTHAELTLGAKHRSKYFENIKEDIDNLRTHPNKACCSLFHSLRNHKQGKIIGTPFIDVFYNILCHINNLDLKTLNCLMLSIEKDLTLEHIEEQLAQNFGKLICKKWQINVEKDGQECVNRILSLRHKWKDFSTQKPGKYLEFMVKTHPKETIPPYESHTNRKPPECQSLVLNGSYLAMYYPHWQSWLKELTVTSDYTKEYINVLSTVLNKQGNALISNENQTLRLLQLLLDRSQVDCPFKLNKLWSHYHKWQQLLCQNKVEAQSEQAKLQKQLKSSALPESLKQSLIEPAFWQSAESFGHFINKYYQTRKRARAQRYFLHIDNTKPRSKRWQSEGKLLRLCSHRPKQKHSQKEFDIPALIGLMPEQLNDALNGVSIDSWLALKGVQTLAQKCATAQKQYGGELKELLTTDSNLQKLVMQVEQKSKVLCDQLNLEELIKTNVHKRLNNVFSYSQLYQLNWGERSGFSSTCPICSLDNSFRMQLIGENQGALASRLPGYSMRLIDGAMTRLLNHQAHHLVHQLWPTIERTLQHGNKLEIPLIFESNKFQFEPDLNVLKGRKAKGGKSLDTEFNMKVDRIKAANSSAICPYGKGCFGANKGDTDHILPRASRYGTLNDEANLIWASTPGNQHKSNKALTLNDLDSGYLHGIFGTKNIDNITATIYQTLLDDPISIDISQAKFCFGRYFNFKLLTPEQQHCFRHALFLEGNDPLRQKVIDAITHSSKSKVNGSQRYMAQLVADIIVKRAAKLGKAKQVSFDYFEYPSDPNKANSTVGLRKVLEKIVANDLLKPFNKSDKDKQHPYSHCIDATAAFLLTVTDHQGEGSIGVQLNQNQFIYGDIDTNTGEVTDSCFQAVHVAPELHQSIAVKPRSGATNLTEVARGTKSLHQAISRRIFKENALGLEFYSINQKGKQVVKGYTTGNQESPFKSIKELQTSSVKNDSCSSILMLLIAKQLYRIKTSESGLLLLPNSSRLQAFLFEQFAKLKQINEVERKVWLKTDEGLATKWLMAKGLYFYSSKTDIINAPKELRKEQSPYYPEWQQLDASWKKEAGEHYNVEDGCYVINGNIQTLWEKFLLKRKGESNGAKHQSIKKITMKSQGIPSGALALIRRAYAGNELVYQLEQIDNNTVPKEQVGLVALTSKNIILFDKDVVTKGYQYQLDEKQDLSKKSLPKERVLNEKGLNSNNLSYKNLSVSVLSNTKIQVRGLPRKILHEAFFVFENQLDEKSVIIACGFNEGKNFVDKGWFESIYNKSAYRSDKKMKVISDGKEVILEVPIRSSQLQKLMC